jgi:hypothetical protein
MKLDIGESVHVPGFLVGLGDNYPSSMVEGKIVARGIGFYIIDGIPGKSESFKVKCGLVQKKLYFLIVQIGDFESEDMLLDPLFDIVVSYTNILLMSENVRKIRVRSMKEFQIFWERLSPIVSNVVIIGHGSIDGLIFGNENITAKHFIDLLESGKNIKQAVQIISLCCKSGNGNFGKRVSGIPFCQSFIGPADNIHACNATIFYQTFINYQMLYGKSDRDSYLFAKAATPGNTKFNMWVKTKLQQ